MHDFDFDKITAAHGAGEPGNADGLFGISGTGSIGKERDALGNEVKDAFLFLGVGPAQGQGDDLGPALFHGCLDQLHVVLPGTQDETALEFMPA